MKRKQRFVFDDKLLIRTWILRPEHNGDICDVCKEILVDGIATYRFRDGKHYVHAGCYWGRNSTTENNPPIEGEKEE